MPHRASHLQLRGSTYWLRLRVPDVLRPMVGRTEIRKSLKTSDYREAQQLARIERIKIDAKWEIARRRLSPALVPQLSERELWQLAAQWFVDTEKRNVSKGEVWKSLDEAQCELDALSVPHNAEAASYPVAEQLLTNAGIRLEPSSESRRLLESYLQQAMLEAARRDVQRSFPSTPFPLDPMFASLNSTTILKPVAKISLKKLISDFQSDPTKPAMSRKTRLKREAQWHAIKEFFGADTEIDQIGRDRVREFVALLQKLPSNATKHFPGATIFEAVEQGAQRGLPVLAVDTANDYLRTLGSLFRHALHEGLLGKDPSDGLLIRSEHKVRAKDKRLPFSNDELKAIFSAPLFRGCQDDERGYAVPGSKIVRRGRFWVPLIALYTGMRLNEICQLTLDDFDVQDKTNIILIRGSDDGETKRVKTAAGHRFVPVHPKLKRMGLLLFVADRRTTSVEDALLFPELSLSTTGYRSDPFSKYFARFLDKVGIHDRKKVFHSFRHNYRDALREADMSIEKVRALGGWTSSNTEDSYGNGLRPATLAMAIEAVDYPGVDMSHLYMIGEDVDQILR